MITVDPKGGFVKVDGVGMTGLNCALKSAFFPNYSFKRATLGTTCPNKGNIDDVPSNPKSKGKLIDRIVGKMCTLCNNGVPLKDLVQNESFKKICVDYVSKQLIPYLIKNELKPIASQVPVAHVKTRIGTTIDLICVDSVGKHVVFEIKIGFDTYYHLHTAEKMSHPFSALYDSLKEQHKLYLLLASYMYGLKHDVAYEKCAVLRMTNSILAVNHLPLDWLNQVPQALVKMEQLKDLHKKSRKAYVRSYQKRRKIN